MPERRRVHIVLPVGPQHGGHAQTDEILQLLQRGGVQKAVDAAQGNDSANILGGQVFSHQVFGIGGQKRCQMPPGGMARHQNAVGASAIAADVPLGPRKGPGDILDMDRMFHAGRNPVADHHGGDAVAREGLPHQRVGLAVAPCPRTAVDKEQHGDILRPPGQVQIKSVLLGIGRGLGPVGNILDHPDREQPAGDEAGDRLAGWGPWRNERACQRDDGDCHS